MNAVAHASEIVSGGETRQLLEDRLATAHKRIEDRFTQGAVALTSIMDVLGQLISSMDRLTGALDGETASAVMASIQKTVTDLAGLPEKENSRGERFGEIAALCQRLHGEVEAMREIMRYLRTFAVTMKITGAQLFDFSSFAEEIRERIQEGAEEVESFGQQLQEMQDQIVRARAISAGMVAEYSGAVPDIVEELHRNIVKIGQEHEAMALLAGDVKQQAQGVQGKIATVLSNLQIGDITRQRIEHIRSAFDILESFIDETSELDPAEEAQMRLRVARLAATQMDETLRDFLGGCADVLRVMSSFAADAQNVLEIRDRIVGLPGAKGAISLSALQESVAGAHALVSKVEASGADADRTAISVVTTAQTLLEGIRIIQQIEIDIHHMALNSTLRCHRLGEAGRSVDVVSAELRTFAAHLERPAGKIVSTLHELEQISQGFGSDVINDGDRISVPLANALSAIRGICTQVDEGLLDFAAEGQNVFSTISGAISTLDFESELGEALRECLTLISTLAVGNLKDDDAYPDAVTMLGAKIFSIYSMAQERDIHRTLFPAAPEQAVVSPSAEALKDDDDLDALLF
jgi:hypothetical protein